MARGGSACLTSVSTHRWPMALGGPLLVLIWDPPTPGGNIILGVGEPACLQVRSTGGEERGKEARSGVRRWGRGSRTLEQGWSVQIWPELEFQFCLQLGWL